MITFISCEFSVIMLHMKIIKSTLLCTVSGKKIKREKEKKVKNGKRSWRRLSLIPLQDQEENHFQRCQTIFAANVWGKFIINQLVFTSKAIYSSIWREKLSGSSIIRKITLEIRFKIWIVSEKHFLLKKIWSLFSTCLVV